MDKIINFFTAIGKIVIDTTRTFLVYIFVGTYMYVGIMGVKEHAITVVEFFKSIEPYVGMMMAFLFGERAALKRPDDSDIRLAVNALTDHVKTMSDNHAALMSTIQKTTVPTAPPATSSDNLDAVDDVNLPTH